MQMTLCSPLLTQLELFYLLPHIHVHMRIPHAHRQTDTQTHTHTTVISPSTLAVARAVKLCSHFLLIHSHIRLVRTLDEIAKAALEGVGPGTSWTRPRSNFAVSGVAIDRENLPDRGFHIAFGSGFEGKVKALLLNHLFNDMSCNTSVIFSSVINKTSIFATTVEGDTDGSSHIVSPVLSVTIGNCAINGTMEAIEITFLVPQVGLPLHTSTAGDVCRQPSGAIC